MKNILFLLEQFHKNACSKTPRRSKINHSSEMQIYGLMHSEGLILDVESDV